MSSNHLKALLALADIHINGERPWDIQIHNDDFYPKVMAGTSLALGESYMAGWWDCEQLDVFFFKVLRAHLDQKVKTRAWFLEVLRAKLFNLQNPARAFQVGQRHYDIGNQLYKCMLDKRMIYSCAYWKNAPTLDEAQEAKLELVCQKLGLQKGMRLLDIGCGWGGAAKFAAECYGVEVVGITVSKEQARFATELCKGLSVDIRLQDYRQLDESFDRILSIGMFEHVGYKNYRRFLKIVSKCLKPQGLFLLHTIGGNKSVTANERWTDRYIFPNSMLPSAKQISAACEGLFVLEDWHSFGNYYDKTLMQWFKNFQESWDMLKDHYDERFYRMWSYYLLSSAGSFRARANQLWQLVLSPEGVLGGYTAAR